MASAKKAQQGENEGGAQGGEPLKDGGVPPTGDQPSDQALGTNDALTVHHPTAETVAPEYNPTTPDGSPPANNLPGPHGPQGHEHLQQDPSEG